MDDELKEMLVKDFERGFECLVDAHQHRLHALGVSLAGSDGEEIAQDAFVRAYRSLAGYSPERLAELRPGPWLHRIALNVFRNRIRSRRLATVSWEDGIATTSHPHGEPEREAERAEDRRQLVELLGRLPARHREAVVLRHVQGLSYEEAAEILGQPVGTVKANVHRGLTQLRRALGGGRR